MSIFPTRSIQTGTGKPRFIKLISSSDSEYYTTTGTPTYSGTTVTDTVALPATIRVGKRVISFIANTGMADIMTYAKVVSITGTYTFQIDEWVHGIPTNGRQYKIDGYIADLFRCEKLTEIYSPEYIIQRIWRTVTKTKFYGYGYEAILDYSNYSNADLFYELKDIMKSKVEGDTDEIIFIPRKDKPNIFYSVYFASPLNFVLGKDLRSNKGLVINLKGKYNVPNPPQFVCDGYGYNYGTDYGTQL